MAAINFPDSPTNGQQHTQNGKTWEYNGVGWILVQSEGATLDWDNITNKPAFGTAALEDVDAFATFSQGSLASSAVQPDDLPTFGDIVTHDVSEFASSAQGSLADSALQPEDNIDISWIFDGDKVFTFSAPEVLQVKSVLLYGVHAEAGTDYIFNFGAQTLTLQESYTPAIDDVLIINVNLS